jgi:hypothetical protein
VGIRGRACATKEAGHSLFGYFSKNKLEKNRLKKINGKKVGFNRVCHKKKWGLL